jgi:dipeptidyl aminopeptidase/acylaminoacyl peptidase
MERTRQLAWFDRQGKRLSAIGKEASIASLRLSPDEKSLVLSIGNRNSSDLWTMDVSTGALTRATIESGTSNLLGPWSPDSSHLAVNKRFSQGAVDLTMASGKTAPLLAAGFYAHDWSADGRAVLCSDLNGVRLSLLSLPGGGQPQTISDQTYRRMDPRFSPDGKSVAFASDESKLPQITVASFPSFTERRQVSVDGGWTPFWRKDSREIIFVTRDNMLMSVEVRIGAKIEAEIPKPLFKLASGPPIFAVTGDGQRILVAEPVRQNETVEYIAEVNWATELKQK